MRVFTTWALQRSTVSALGGLLAPVRSLVCHGNWWLPHWHLCICRSKNSEVLDRKGSHKRFDEFPHVQPVFKGHAWSFIAVFSPSVGPPEKATLDSTSRFSCSLRQARRSTGQRGQKE